jgi:hypothetical protein
MGAPNDAAAQKLRDQAINQDYLATDFASAEKKLTDALSLCKKTSDCSPFIRARVHCDLGVVEYMLHKVDLARTEFATALLEDPNIDLDKDLSNTDVQNEFAASKSGGPPPVSAGPTTTTTTSPSGAQTGGMKHIPPARQQVQTPLPLYVEVQADLGASKVIARYKPVGARDWKTTQLRKMGDGFGGEIPCGDVGRNEGELQYFIQALDANGDLVAASGRSATPQVVAIVKKLDGEAPHLPGQPPPEACKPGSAESAPGTAHVATESGDCPPDFPGCHAEGPGTCESKEDCMAGETCVEGTCRKGGEDESRPYKKNWLSLAVQVELPLMQGATNACLGGAGYTCFRSDTGAYYADVPAKDRHDEVIGGFATSPMVRILIGYDRVVLRNVAIGGRVGYAVFGGGPQRPVNGSASEGPSFMPLHVEARVAYWFGKNVFAHKGMRFYAFASGGMTEVDASQSIDLFQPGPRGANIAVDAWTKTGLGFAAVGPGIMYAVTPNGGLILEVKPIVLFPTFGFAVGAQLGYTIGL